MVINLSGVSAAEIAAQEVIVQQEKIALDKAQRNPLNVVAINTAKANYGRENAKLIQLKAKKAIEDRAAESVTASVSQYAAPISNTVKWVAVGVAGIALIYGLSVARPFLPRVRESRALSFSGVNKKNKKYSIAWKLENKIWLQRHFGGRIFKHYIQNGTEYSSITPFSTLREGNEKTGWIY